MDFQLKTLDAAGAAREKCDALVLVVPEGQKPGKDPLSRLAGDAIKAGDFETKAGKTLQSYKPAGISATRVILAGAGDGSAKKIHAAVCAAVNSLKSVSTVKRLVIVLPQSAGDDAVRAAVSATAESSYVYVTTKSKPEGRAIERVTIGVANKAASDRAFKLAQALASGIELTREIGNLPANIATPTRLGEEAKKLAKEFGLKCEVLGPKEIEKLGMGSFLAVAQGSEEPARFIVLEYKGASNEAPIVLVGKGITFDTGGISIKPAPEMDEMKFDMCGAGSVLGTFRALAEAKPRLNVVGLIPTCENMPDGRAVKPGDIVKTMNGQTVEILNTDAEGRLILCDALSYAERYKPSCVVDIATLTGACVVALGFVRSGLFSPDDGLAQELLTAGEQALDTAWRMPLDDEYAEGLKTNFADVANVTGGRWGGAITAAKFLQRFTAKYPWAHLDVAGTASKGGAQKGATGRPVGLLFQFLLSREAGSAAPAPKKAKR